MKMKGIAKLGFKLYGKVVIATIMAFFVVISVNVIANGFMSQEVGYQAYGIKEGSEKQELLYEHLFSDGEDTQKEKFKEQGYKITEQKTLRITKSGETFFLIAAQIFSLMILMAFIYSFMWKEGIRDNNLTKFGHIKADKLKGLKVGFVASIPYGLFMLVLFVMRFITHTNFSAVLIQFLNSHVYSFTWLLIKNDSFLDISFIRMLGLLALGLVVPIISGMAYLIGFKDISLGEKLLYKKKK